jgi:hypothetical protein
MNNVTSIVGKTFWMKDRITDDVSMNDCRNIKCCDRASNDVKPRMNEIGKSQNIVRPLSD